MVELLIVMMIIIILSTMALTGFSKVRETTRKSRCLSEIRGMEREIGAWAVEKGSYPPSLASFGRGELRDPWGTLYNYGTPYRMAGGEPINSDFELFSNGSDMVTAADGSLTAAESEDDLIRGRDGAFAGLAIEY